jgi:hypothetical protein
MSKKKNTLKDLDEFLKQQAASLVSPEKLSPKKETKEEPEEAGVEYEEEAPGQPEPLPPLQESPVMQEVHEIKELTFKDIFKQLQQLAQKNEPVEFRKKLFDLILATIDTQHHQIPEDKILINTMLYLKHGTQWKEGIKEYWKNHE